MGSFEGHALPGTLFLLVGLWHVWSAVARHASGPGSFRVRAWSPAPDWLAGGRLAHLELYLIFGGSFLDLCIELYLIFGTPGAPLQSKCYALDYIQGTNSVTGR